MNCAISCTIRERTSLYPPALPHLLPSSTSGRIRIQGEQDIEGAATIPDYFTFLNRYDPAQISALLGMEKAQTVAVVLGCLPSSKSAAVLKKLSPEKRNEVTKRLATSGEVSETVIAAIERTLRKKLKGVEPSVEPGLGR